MSRALRTCAAAGVVCAALAVTFALPRAAVAHEHRRVGPFEMVVGWADEPTFVGFKNGVQLLLRDAAGKPVTDLGDTLKVEVIFGDQKMAPVTLERAFGKTYGTPGDYRAPLVPTRPGNYTFHFTGTIKDQQVDQSFTSSEKTFDPATAASEIEFPVKDPSRPELAQRIERLGPRIDSVAAAANEAKAATGQAMGLAAGGIVLGVVGIGLALSGRRRGSGA